MLKNLEEIKNEGKRAGKLTEGVTKSNSKHVAVDKSKYEPPVPRTAPKKPGVSDKDAQ